MAGTYLFVIRVTGKTKMGLMLLIVSASFYARGQDLPSIEYQVKAGFLYNFCQFVQWPEQAFSSPDSPLVIGILGKDPFGSYLDETVKNETANDHPLTVMRFNSVEEIDSCHILFININKRDDLREALEALASKSILTVSDAPNFSRNGGIVTFLTEENKTKIRINLRAARNGNLVISSKLLRISEIIENGD